MQEEQFTPAPTPAAAATKNEGIDIKEILVAVWIERKFVAIVVGICVALGVFIALASPVRYTAGSTVVPQMGQQGKNGLDGLAAMAGISLGSNLSSEVLSPLVYPEIIKSVPFTRAIMQTPVSPIRAKGKTITLYEFYSNKAYNPPSLLETITNYTVGLPGLLLSAIRGDDPASAKTVRGDSLRGIQAMNKQEGRVYQIIQGNIAFQANTKEGSIRLHYTFPEAEGAAQVAEHLQQTLERFVVTYKLEKVQENLDFVEKSYRQARRDFLEKQAALAAYQDANRGLATATSRGVERRLSSEYDIAFTVYNELAKQREQAQLAVKENKPVLTVVNPVVIPAKKSAPRRAIIVGAFLFLGLLVGIGWVVVKPFLSEIRMVVAANKPAAEGNHT